MRVSINDIMKHVRFDIRDQLKQRFTKYHTSLSELTKRNKYLNDDLQTIIDFELDKVAR